MKPFAELTYPGQVRRLRRLAESALADYDFGDARLKFIDHAENTTFRVDAATAGSASNAAPVTTAAPGNIYAKNRFLLRIHRPGYQTAESIAAELAWLAALRRDSGLPVPEPVPTSRGEQLTEIRVPGVPQPRVCTLLRWIEGRFYGRRPRPVHFAAMGRLMAHLHDHAARWQPPPGFARRHWDWDGLFGDGAGSNLSGNEVWALLPRRYRGPFRAVAEMARRIMRELGRGPDAFGLIHADLHLGNVLFSGGQARAIDFDDCGFGYWAYDFAVPLCESLDCENRRDLRAALLHGYAQVRPLPKEQLAHVDTIMAARQVSLALWATDLAQINPDFRDSLDRWLAWIAEYVGRFLDGHRTFGKSAD